MNENEKIYIHYVKKSQLMKIGRVPYLHIKRTLIFCEIVLAPPIIHQLGVVSSQLNMRARIYTNGISAFHQLVKRHKY